MKKEETAKDSWDASDGEGDVKDTWDQSSDEEETPQTKSDGQSSTQSAVPDIDSWRSQHVHAVWGSAGACGVGEYRGVWSGGVLLSFILVTTVAGFHYMTIGKYSVGIYYHMCIACKYLNVLIASLKFSASRMRYYIGGCVSVFR